MRIERRLKAACTPYGELDREVELNARTDAGTGTDRSGPMLTLKHGEEDPPTVAGITTVETVGVVKVAGLIMFVTLRGTLEEIERVKRDKSFMPGESTCKENEFLIGGEGKMVTRVLAINMRTGERELVSYNGSPLEGIACKEFTIFMFVRQDDGQKVYQFKANGQVMRTLPSGQIPRAVKARAVGVKEVVAMVRVRERVFFIDDSGVLIMNLWLDVAGVAYPGDNSGKGILSQSGAYRKAGGPKSKK